MKRTIRLLDSSGDTRVDYSLDDPESLAQARALFDRAIKKGGSAFSVTAEGSTRISKFEDAKDDTVLVPCIVAG